MYDAAARTPAMKASDADRDAVLAALSEHFQAGRLTQDELEDRTGRALAARTHGELDALMADLPGWRRPAAAPPQAVPLQPAAGPPDFWRMRPLVPAIAVVAAAVIVATVLGLGVHAGVWLVVVIPLLLVRKLLRGDRSLPRSRRF
jgi:Flp pilus assembly protein TadB